MYCSGLRGSWGSWDETPTRLPPIEFAQPLPSSHFLRLALAAASFMAAALILSM